MSQIDAQDRIVALRHDYVADSINNQEHPPKWQAVTIVVIGLVFCAGVALEISPLNGLGRFTSWTWQWRDLGILKTGALLLIPFAMNCWVLLSANKKPLRTPIPMLLSILAFSSFLLQVCGMLADPHGIRLIADIVASPTATSYFSDASKIQSPLEWLAHFHTASLNLHSSTHPPGPVLFYYLFLKLFGPGTGALVGGCAVGLLAASAVFVMYPFAGLWTNDRKTRLTICAFYALLPAITVFFPEFDQVYPIFAMLLILFWVRALLDEPSRLWFSAAFGLTLFVATFFAYNLLMVGIFLIGFSMYWLWLARWSQIALAGFAKACAVALAAFVSLHALLFFATGYRALGSFAHALAIQKASGINAKRHYLNFVVLDPYDFFLGAGILALPLVLFHLHRVLKDLGRERLDIALTFIGISTILLVDISGLLRGEVTRVWIFLQPLLAIPVGIELSRHSERWKISIFALQWLILVCLKAKMTFLYP